MFNTPLTIIFYFLSLISQFSILNSHLSILISHFSFLNSHLSSLTFMGSIILLIKIGQPACSTLFSSAVSEYYYLRINFERTSLVRRIEGLSSAVCLFTLIPTPSPQFSTLNSQLSVLSSQFTHHLPLSSFRIS